MLSLHQLTNNSAEMLVMEDMNWMPDLSDNVPLTLNFCPAKDRASE